MKQIIPAPLDNPPSSTHDRVFDDAPETAPSQAPVNLLNFIFFIATICAIFYLGVWSQNHAPRPPLTGPYETSGKAPAGAQNKIMVHVAGAVRRPGVYTLPLDARIQDALQKAGGALPTGNPNALNLAAWAEDGSRIEVPFKTTVASSEKPEESLITIAQPPEEPSGKPTPTTSKSTAKPGAITVKTKPGPTRKINLNTASLDDLTLLPGVGPATAEKIIGHRKTNGTFSSVDDLDDIKGIGEKKLEKIRPYATVR